MYGKSKQPTAIAITAWIVGGILFRALGGHSLMGFNLWRNLEKILSIMGRVASGPKS